MLSKANKSDMTGEKQIRVLHVDDKMNWAGGQNQVYLLFKKQLSSSHICPFIAVRAKSALWSKAGELGNLFEFSLLNEFDPYAVFKMLRIINKTRPDIIHCHTPHSLMIVYSASRLSAKRPKIIAMRRVDNPVKCRLKYTIASDCIVAISDNIKKALLSSGFRDENIHVIKSAVDCKEVSRLADIQNDSFNKYSRPGTIKIGSISSLYKHKGIDILIRAFAMLCSQDGRYQLFIAGEGDQKDYLVSLAADLGISEHVTFIDFTEEPYGFIKFLDIIVFPSRTEGLGTTILDSLIINTPIIASHAGGIPEIISDRKNGLLFKAGDYNDLYQKLKKMTESPGVIEDLRQNSSTHLPEWIDIDKNSAEYELLYKRLLNIEDGGK